MSTKPRPTMMDIAAHAGVSQATVSLILNESPGASFSVATRERVQKSASELGYQLVRRSGTSVPNESRYILFLADDFTSDPWMTLAYDGAREKALEMGINVTLNITRSREADSVIALHMPQSVVGVVYGTILTRAITPPPRLLEGPTVLLNCYDEKRRLASVLPGDVAGGRTATEHLIKQGRKRIALINGQDGLDAPRDRLNGYRQALASHDLPIDPELIRPGNWEPSSGYEQTMALLALDNPPDGIFCANDMIAVGCYDALKESGLRIPKDVSVIGFDDREIAQFTRPPSTTLILPQFEMGRLAAELLLDSTAGMPERPNQLKVECPLVVRSS